MLPAGEQFVKNFPVGLRSGVQQHHRPVMGPGQQLGESLLRCGLGIVVPIHIGQAPENRLVAHGLGLLQVLLAVNPLGRAVKFGNFLPGDGLVEFFQVRQFFLEHRRVGQGTHVPVVHGVIAYDMALLHHPPDQVPVPLQIIPHQKKSRRGVVLFQCLQNFCGRPVFVARIEGQVQDLLLGVAQVGRIVPGQLGGCGVADGRSPLLLKAQAPAARGHGFGRKNRQSQKQGHSQGRNGQLAVPFPHIVSPFSAILCAGKHGNSGCFFRWV